MSLDKIHQLIGSITKTVEDNHKIATPILAVKLAKCVKEFPYDQTIGALSTIIEKLADNNKLFITRAELKDLYNKLYSRDTKFAQLFNDELGTVEVKKENKKPVEDVSNVNLYETADPILSNALNSLFDKSTPKMYSQALADKAIKEVYTDLDSFGLKPSSVTVSDGNDKFLVLKADYDTPKGITSFYVPIEINNNNNNNKISEASIFMGNSGLSDLNHNNVKNYIKSNAGARLRINGSIILETLNKSASENKQISNAELALIKLNTSRKNKSDFFQNQIIGQKVAEASVKDVELPKYDEFVSFEKQFTSPNGIANFKFGSDKIKIAKDCVLREMVSMGYINPQLSITDSNDNTIFYGVSLDSGKVAFTVPVKISNNCVNKPSIFLCNGSVSTLDKSNIEKLYLNNKCDYKVAASVSPLFGLKPSDLINNIRVAFEENNVEKAEDALNVLANSNDEKAYAIGFNAFLQGLADKKSENKCSCNMIIRNSTSQHPICGHTGLPLHKVYQDKNGNCLPLYRKGMDETYEGATFINAKIFG